MNGKQSILHLLEGGELQRPPLMPIVHTALAPLQNVSLGSYFNQAEVMARVAIEGARHFTFDGVQLTLGVVAEPEALGAHVDKPAEGVPVLRERLLSDLSRLPELESRLDSLGGRLPMYQDAVAEVVETVGSELFVLSTLRGPLNIAAQLRGIEDLLIDMLQDPESAQAVLEFTTEVAIRVARMSLSSSAHGIMFGEATCSPNFISPAMYREIVQPLHCRLVREVRAMGWKHVGLHVCGNILPILEDLIATGANLLDVDYQVPACEAITRAAGRVTLRGNLDPSSVFFLGTENEVSEQTAALTTQVAGSRWILGSGCDIPPGTSQQNLRAFVQSAR